MRRILYVDDNYAERIVLKISFETSQPVRVDCAESAAEGMLYLANNTYDLIISDIMMPDKSGPCFLREIREKGIKTPALMISQSCTPSMLEDAPTQENYCGFLIKPVTPQKVFELSKLPTYDQVLQQTAQNKECI